MSLLIPEKFLDLFSRPILCGITTINPDGHPHSVPVWCDYDGTHVRVNFRMGTKKVRNIKADGKLCLLVIDPQNAGHWIEIQGHAAELIGEEHGARKHINQLSQKYTGNPVYKPYGAGSSQDRLMVVIEAVKINGT